MTADHVIVVDQGTTGTTAMIFDRTGRVAGRAYREITQHYPSPGLVEHDPEEIWRSAAETLEEVLAASGLEQKRLAGLGLTNQRETTILWDRATGLPLHRAVVWQDRRTTEDCHSLAGRGLAGDVAARTGLRLDPYFSATKIRWLLDHAPDLRVRAARGEVAFGTVDSWLLWKLTGGAVHATDVTNASRTLLFNIHDRVWDDMLLGALDIPAEILPRVLPPAHDFGAIREPSALAGVPVAGVAGDQQAALVGQACFSPGESKNTYGTGAFVMMNLGRERVLSRNGLLTTLAVGESLEPVYALEGSVFIAGAAIQWLRDGLGLIASAAETEKAALSVPDTGGVYLVPSFVGLGSPHWEPRARGAIVGLTRGTRKNHLIRAALESLAYQTGDVIGVMESDSGLKLESLKVDGGAAANDFLMQFQADILDSRVRRPEVHETTALGAAYLAGLATGVWKDTAEVRSLWRCEREFEPGMDPATRSGLCEGWRKAVGQVLAGVA